MKKAVMMMVKTVSCEEEGQSMTTCEELTPQELTTFVQDSQLNWFEIAERLENTHGRQCPHIKQSSQLIDLLEVSMKEKEQLRISYEVFVLDEQFNVSNRREANVHNGDITESKSDDPDSIHCSQTPLDGALKKVIEKKRASIKWQAQRTKAKRIVEQNSLGRKVTKRLHSIVKKYPDIGDTTETFVRDNNIGAEAWRRTGMLLFDGNVKKKQKVIYEKIRKHLKSVYQRKFSYGTVQLCVARNKRHQSASHYKSIAKVTTRQARKGFQLRYNLDFHWSNALYCAWP